MNEFLSLADLITAPLLFILFFMMARSIKNKHIEREPYYRYFTTCMFIKIIGGIAVCLVYIFYYGGGDTLNYYHDNTCLVKLFLKEPFEALRYTFGKVD